MGKKGGKKKGQVVISSGADLTAFNSEKALREQ